MEHSPQDNLNNIQINTNYETHKEDSATWLLGYLATYRVFRDKTTTTTTTKL